MPYRIAVTWDVPDGPKPQDAAIRAYESYMGAEEAIGKADGDTQYDEVEWYGFDPDEKEGPWTYADEELLRELRDHLASGGIALDGDPVDEWLANEADDDEQAARVAAEHRTRPAPERTTLHCVVIEWGDGTVQVNGPYQSLDEAQIAGPKIAQKIKGTGHLDERSQVVERDPSIWGIAIDGDYDNDDDAIDIYIQPMGEPIQTQR